MVVPEIAAPLEFASFTVSGSLANINAALNGSLDHVAYVPHPVFGMAMPTTCPGVPSGLLDPRSTWPDPAAYDEMAGHLADWFIKNFEKYVTGVSEEILQAAPVTGRSGK